MDEAAAHAWLVGNGVSRETLVALATFAKIVRDGAEQHNLVAKSSIETIWTRHIVDSAQLTLLAPKHGAWYDIGSGAGFPGLVIALLDPARSVMLVEPRRLRADFLRTVADRLRLDHVEIIARSAEAIRLAPAAVISARAVAPLAKLLAAAHHLSDPDTVWVLPKGRSAASELAEAEQAWQGGFTLHQSVTDPEARIVVARGVKPRSGR